MWEKFERLRQILRVESFPTFFEVCPNATQVPGHVTFCMHIDGLCTGAIVLIPDSEYIASMERLREKQAGLFEAVKTLDDLPNLYGDTDPNSKGQQ